MRYFLKLLCLLVILHGCASQAPQSQKNMAPAGKYDGQYRYEDRTITMTMNIRGNAVKGYLRNNSWPSDIRMQISGKVVDDKFQIDYIHHPDVRKGFEMEVTSASSNRINGWIYDDSNKRYSWSMTRVNEVDAPNEITQPEKSDDKIE